MKVYSLQFVAMLSRSQRAFDIYTKCRELVGDPVERHFQFDLSRYNVTSAHPVMTPCVLNKNLDRADSLSFMLIETDRQGQVHVPDVDSVQRSEFNAAQAREPCHRFREDIPLITRDASTLVPFSCACLDAVSKAYAEGHVTTEGLTDALRRLAYDLDI